MPIQQRIDSLRDRIAQSVFMIKRGRRAAGDHLARLGPNSPEPTPRHRSTVVFMLLVCSTRPIPKALMRLASACPARLGIKPLRCTLL